MDPERRIPEGSRTMSSPARRLLNAVSVALGAVCFSTAPHPPSAGAAPPIPTPEARDAFVRAHQAGLEAAAWRDSTRAVHDEYDVASYDVDLLLDIPNRTIYGTVGTLAVAAVPNLSLLSLDLFSPMVVDAVRVDGAPASFTHTGTMVRVTLPHLLQPGDSVLVACDYHGRPSYSGAPFRWVTHGDGVPMVLTYSEPYGAPAWWVCKDDPKDKATFSIHVTAPDTLMTVSNGLLESIVPNGDGTATCNWAHDYPMSPYLFSLATTNFAKWTEVYTALDQVTTMDVDYYAFPEDLADAQASWGRNIGMMEYFAGLFGEYPFLTEKYAIAEFMHPGAMEHQTATSMGWGWVTGTDENDWVVAHELSHSWVGDMITMRQWSHAWTKEGFATLSEALYFESLYGQAYYHEYMDSMNVLYYAPRQLYNINPPLDGAIYYKGAWVLHMLRHVIGDDAFFEGIRLYTNDPDFMYGVSDTEGLRGAFEEASGSGLAWFFQEWIYNPGYPKYSMTWMSQPSGRGYEVRLDLTQTQTVGQTFRMPLDIRIGTDMGELDIVIVDSLRTQSFVFQIEGEPYSLELDPDGWVIKEVQDLTGVEEAEGWADGSSMRIVPNPFTRAAQIGFSLGERAAVSLRVYDLQGRLVHTLYEGVSEAGRHAVSWDGLSSKGARAPSGVYHTVLRIGSGVSRGRVILLR